MKITDFLVNLVFPKICLGCKNEGFYLCQNCLEKITLSEKFSCPGCGKLSFLGKTCSSCQNKISLDGLIFATSYKILEIKESIRLLKYEFVKELARPLAGILIKLIKISHFFSNFSLPISNFLLIPIPLHQKKFLRRGFNQAELIANEISNQFDLKLRNDLLIKVKETPSQTDLKEKERLLNIKDVFHVKDKKEVKEKIIFLIDDVITTGATLNEAAKVLKKSGAREVWGLTVAQG